MPDKLPRPPETRRQLLTHGWLLVAVGLTVSTYVGWEYFRQRDYFSHAARAPGRIVGNLPNQQRSGLHYTAIFSFADAHGKSWRVFEPGYRDKLIPTPPGQDCLVVYDPGNPANAQIEPPDLLDDVLARTRTVWFGARPAVFGLVSLWRAYMFSPGIWWSGSSVKRCGSLVQILQTYS